MNVVVVAPYGANRYHFETDLELAQRHLSRGDRVTVLTCSADLWSCDVNVNHEADQCLNCIFRRRSAIRSLEGRARTEPLVDLTAEDLTALDGIRTTFSDLEDLRTYRFEDLDVGTAVLSTLVSSLRDPEPSVIDEADRIRDLVVSSITVYLSFKRRLERDRPDRVYAFNGRFAIMRPILRACQEAGVDCLLHDRGSAIDRFALYENALPHSVEVMQRRIVAAWEAAAGTNDRERIAAAFFEGRRRGEIRNWYSFTSHQDEALLPKTWDRDHHNVVVFPSSEDEFVAIGDEWRNPVYSCQEEGIHRVVGELRGVAGLRCHIRIHPNLRNLNYDSLTRVMALDGDNIHVVAPESAVGSYAMLLEADVVLTFGSTMGIEATYWGKPSVLAGRCFYRGLGATYNPPDHAGVVTLLRRPPAPKDRLGALQFGYFFATFGERFEHFHPDSLTGGMFRGRRVGPGPMAYRLIVALRSPLGAAPRRLLGGILDLRASMRRRGG